MFSVASRSNVAYKFESCTFTNITDESDVADMLQVTTYSSTWYII